MMRRLSRWAAAVGVAYCIGALLAFVLFNRYCLPQLKEMTPA